MSRIDRRTVLKGSAVAAAAAPAGVVRISQPPGGSAWPWRSALGVIQWYAEGPVAAAQKFVTSGHRAVVKASAGGYVNYVEAGRSVNSYYGTSLGRLHAVKKKYDGSDFFRTPYTFA